MLNATEPKPDNSATDIWNQQSLKTEVAYTLMPDQKPLDKVNAQKMIALNATQDTAGFMNAFNAIETNKGGLLTPDNSPIVAYKADIRGETAVMEMTRKFNGELVQTTFEYVTFTDISGKERGTWQVTLSISESDSRFDSSIK
jgi:hypothetical protein